MNANCTAFERWLDEGNPVAGDSAARAHAAGCAHCATLLELEQALRTPLRAQAGDGFSDAVMDRIHAAPIRAGRPGALMFPVPVWAQALLDPLLALALTALALIVVGRDALWAAGASLAARWTALQWPALEWPAIQWPVMHLPGASALEALPQAFAGLAASPTLFAVAFMALTPVVLLGSWVLFRWTDRCVSGVAVHMTWRSGGMHAVAR